MKNADSSHTTSPSQKKIKDEELMILRGEKMMDASFDDDELDGRSKFGEIDNFLKNTISNPSFPQLPICRGKKHR